MAKSAKAVREEIRQELFRSGMPAKDVALELAARLHVRPRVAWRYAMGWPQWKLVQEFRYANPHLAVRESRVSEWESWPFGGTRPSLEVLAALAAAFGHGCVVADLLDEADLQQMSDAERRLVATRKIDIKPALSTSFPGSAQEAARVSPVPENSPSSLTYALGMVESGQPDGLGTAIDALEEVIAFSSDKLATVGPAPVLADLLAARQFARSLFDKYQPVGARAADVQAAAAWLSSLLAIASSYRGDHTSALVWALDAQNRGQAAGHPVISGWALLTRATVSHYQGRGARSLDLAREGAAVAPVGTVAFAKLTCQQMRSHASLGDRQGMQAARRQAQAAISALEDDGNAGVHSIARAAEPPYTAASLLLVGEYAEALAITEDLIIAAYLPGRARETSSYARTLLVLALAQAGLGKLDEAAATGATALGVPGIVWPTVVLAGKLDHALAGAGSSEAAEVSEFAGLYRDAARDLAAAGSGT
ncbi:hypothetical protein [Promicromonospora panici]|uniref:hypothetical protein n=1 Tax=Promicromonospora panici TaxID=2219658 RepID=UPI00101D6311|nr:hypothetical protein [Promicromonospora panici]